MKNTKLLVLVIIIILIAAVGIVFQDILWLFAIAGLLAFLLSPLSRFIMNKLKIRKGLSILLVFLILGISGWAIGSVLLGPIVDEIMLFVENLGVYFSSLEAVYYDAITWLQEIGIPQDIIDLINATLSDNGSLQTIFTNIQTVLSEFLLSVVSSAITSSARILDLVIILTLTVYFMVDTRKLIKIIVNYLPRSLAKKTFSIIDECYNVVWSYLKSKSLVSLGMGITTFIVFSIIGVEFALVLATMAFILDYIPYFGSIIAGVVAASVALLTGGVYQAIIVGVCVLIIQQIEGNIVVPKVQGDSVGLHPIMVLFAILACNQLWGPLGMFIAVPLGGILKILIREVYNYMVKDVDLSK